MNLQKRPGSTCCYEGKKEHEVTRYNRDDKENFPANKTAKIICIPPCFARKFMSHSYNPALLRVLLYMQHVMD